MPLKDGDKLWIAEAPAGTKNAVPVVIFDLSKYGIEYQDIIDRYILMGWTITPAVVTE